MLTKEQYKALQRYRDVPSIPVGDNGLSDVDQYLAKQGYIEPTDLAVESIPGIIQVFFNAYCITQLGRVALSEYDQKKRERWFQVFLCLLSALAGSVCALLVEWCLGCFFH